jgi:LysM repeat protein
MGADWTNDSRFLSRLLPRWRRMSWPVLLAVLLTAATTPPPASAQTTSGSRTVTVRSGDTLEGISQRTGVSVAELKRLNGLKDADLLQVGQTLRLSTPPRKSGTVVIKSGDTLDTIAKAHNTTVAALQKANPGVQPEKLKVGSTLRLPSSAPQPAPSQPKAAPAPAPASPPAKTASPPPATPTVVPDAPPLSPSVPPVTPAPPVTSAPPEATTRGRWRYYGDTVVDWGSWKRLQDGVRFTLVQAAAKDVGPERAQATAIAVDCSTLRHTWRVKEAWEAWTVPAPRSVGQQIVLDLCGNTAVDERRPVPPPPSPAP